MSNIKVLNEVNIKDDLIKNENNTNITNNNDDNNKLIIKTFENKENNNNIHESEENTNFYLSSETSKNKINEKSLKNTNENNSLDINNLNNQTLISSFSNKQQNKNNIILQEKLEKLNSSNVIKNVIYKSLEDSGKKVISNIVKNNNIISSRNNENKSKNLKSDYSLNILKSLKNSEDAILKKLKILKTNKIIYENELSLNNSIINKNINQSKIKELNNQRNLYYSKLSGIHSEIDSINNNNQHSIKKEEKLKNYYENLDKSIDDYNSLLSKIEQNQSKVIEKFNKDKKESLNKRIKSLEKIEKEEKENKEKFLNDMKIKEKEIFLKRKKEADLKMEKAKKYIKFKSIKNEEDYTYYKLKEKFEKKEKNLIKKVNLMKKDSLVSKEEIEELDKKINGNKLNKKIEKEEKFKQLNEFWSNRNSLLPSFKSSFQIKVEDEELKNKENIQNLKNIKISNFQKKLQFSDNISKPEISLLLKNERENRVTKYQKKNVVDIQNINKKRIENLLNLYQSPKIKKNYKKVNSCDNLYDNCINDIKDKTLKTYKKYKKPYYALHPISDKPINYLKHNENYKLSNNFKSLNNLKNINDLNYAIKQTEFLDQKIKNKKQIINYNGGFFNNIELSDQVTDMMIDSIQAKMKIIKKISKKDNKN